MMHHLKLVDQDGECDEDTASYEHYAGNDLAKCSFQKTQLHEHHLEAEQL